MIQQYATASDGTPLHWQSLFPTGTKDVDIIVEIHGGGFKRGGTGVIGICGPDLVAAGFGVVSVEYRLAPPGALVGQHSSGRFPDQTDDIKLSIEAALNQPRSNGVIKFVGGSAGAGHAAMMAAWGYGPAVCMSPVTQLDSDGNENFVFDCNNYAPNDLIEASPNTYVNQDSKPVFTRAYEFDQLPASQYLTQKEAYENAGVEHDMFLLPGAGHSFVMWPIIKNQVIAWLKSH